MAEYVLNPKLLVTYAWELSTKQCLGYSYRMPNRAWACKLVGGSQNVYGPFSGQQKADEKLKQILAEEGHVLVQEYYDKKTTEGA